MARRDYRVVWILLLSQRLHAPFFCEGDNLVCTGVASRIDSCNGSTPAALAGYRRPVSNRVSATRRNTPPFSVFVSLLKSPPDFTGFRVVYCVAFALVASRGQAMGRTDRFRSCADARRA